MRTYLLFFLFLIFSGGKLSAQIKAVTETGDEVILFDDGTWNYLNKDDDSAKVILLNPTVFTRGEDATFLLKSTVIPAGIWLDPKKWTFQKNTGDTDEEYELKLKEGDVFAIIITEEVELSPDALRKIVVSNAREAGSNFHILKEEDRMVNGRKVLMLNMTATIQGIKVFYFGYYVSDPSGTVQFVTYTTQNLADKYYSTMEELLNGLVKL